MKRLAEAIRDARGAAVMEFGIVAPVLLFLLMAGFDTAHSLYMRAAMQGAVQKTARDSSLETNTGPATQTAIDDKVRRQILALHRQASITIVRRFYRTFTDAANATPEPWSDADKDGICDHGETYQDNNANQVWDADGGDAGQGGAKDKTLYTVTVTYPRMFPMWRFLGMSNTAKVVASTVLGNQPYTDQASYSTNVVQRTCS